MKDRDTDRPAGPKAVAAPTPRPTRPPAVAPTPPPADGRAEVARPDPGARRKFRREGEAQRQNDLIAAAQELIAEGGPQSATVRAIAERAGVTPGLIRHYFRHKEDLLCAAYAQFIETMTAQNHHVLAALPPDPLRRLAHFVATSLQPPVVDGRMIGLWAGFIHMVRHDPAMLAIHRRGYLDYRDELQALIGAALAAAGRPAPEEELRDHATACNALIDGLWLEGSLLVGDFPTEALRRLGLGRIGRLLDLPLAEAAPPVPGAPADTPRHP